MSSKKPYIEIVKFKRHFRIYFKNNHPAYIVGEDGDLYIFHRVTHSKTSGGRKNWEKVPNPIVGSDQRAMYIVKKEQKDFKNRFSPYKLTTYEFVDISYPDIKKTGSTQAEHEDRGRETNATSKIIKPNVRKNHKKKEK